MIKKKTTEEFYNKQLKYTKINTKTKVKII